jgi:hypothetical protein
VREQGVHARADEPASHRRSRDTLIVHRGNVDEVVPTLGLPCVLKLPDSGFGLDVVKLESEELLREEAERFLQGVGAHRRPGVAATSFDWRVGVFDQRPLFVCKYFMAPGTGRYCRWPKASRSRATR